MLEKEIIMDLNCLNPLVRDASIYEKIPRRDECVGYDCLILYVISGDVSVTVDGGKLGHIGAGNLIFIPAGTPYKLKGQYVRMAAIRFDLTADRSDSTDRIAPVTASEFNHALLHTVSDAAPFDKPIHAADFEGERDSLIRMCSLFTSAEGCYRAELSALLKLILLHLAEEADENALPSRMVEALDEYIRNNIGDEISNTEIGAIFGYHPFYVSRVLKDRKGMTLRQYIISHRLKLAKRLLELTDRPVADIASECGFSDASYFTKTFRQSFGITPKDYRNSFKEDFI